MKPKHALGALIEDTIERNHWTQESVVERARRSGFKISTQNLSRIKNSPVTTLVPEQVRAIAAGLQLPVSVVLTATLESLGFTNEPSRQLGVEEAVKYDHRLSARDRRILAAVVTELLATDDEKAGGEHDQRSAPTYEAGTQPAQDQTAKPRPVAADREGVASGEAKVHTLNPPNQGDPAPPADIAARDIGTPSRGQQLREEQDDAAERPDEELGDRFDE